MRLSPSLVLLVGVVCLSALAVQAGTRTYPTTNPLPTDDHVNTAAASYTPAALRDQIHNLPGLSSPPSFNMFSGYLTVDIPSNRSLFYWYVESSGPSPATAPLIWWSNGGPGCSGLLGFLTEHGPFRTAPSPSNGLETFPFAWNTLANVLYVEAPAGVGFSFSNHYSDYTTGDAKTAADNLLAIQQFFKRFPALTQNDFYISAESYGGHYVPTLAQAILQSNSLPNFRGFLLGNPLTDMDENANWGQAGTICGHSLASRPTCDAFTTHCLGASGPDGWCNIAQGAVIAEAGALDAYGLDFPTCPQSAQARRMLHTLYAARKLETGFPSEFKQQLDAIPTPYDPCEMAEETIYLNRLDVRTALHVNPQVGAWESCSNKVSYSEADVNARMEPVYTSLLSFAAKNPQIRMLIFSGDDDSVCATLGTQHWMFSGLLGNPVSKWGPWFYNSEEYGNQIGGYLVQFKGISLATVHGAGHMVSGYQPEKGLAVLSNFLSGAFTSKAQAALKEEDKAEEIAPEVAPVAPRRHRQVLKH